MGFSKNFVWGAATASYQIEGAAYKDGKGLSIWDIFSGEPGNIFEGHTGEISCDHYNHMKEDVKRMAGLGLKAYRFSVSWPRILPYGTGPVNERGLTFYSALIDELLKYGITPYMTIFHWDYPYELHRRGGWLNPDSSFWFEEYTEVLSRNYGDRVKHFFTINEPQIFMGCGYQQGIHAPGLKYTDRELLKMSYNVMLAHGRAVKTLRKLVPDCRVGYAPTCGAAFYPAIEKEEHIKAARAAYEVLNKEFFLFTTEFWNEPLLKGRIPEEWKKVFGGNMPLPSEQELIVMNQPLDFLGMNIYQGRAVQADEKNGFTEAVPGVGHGKTGIGWPVTPECIRWAPKFLYEKYHIPILITENGMSGTDWISLDNKVHDPNRIDYIHRHLIELKRTAEEGADIAGYFYWSFMDNFEWANGYNDRFGLVYVDYGTQERINKDSYQWYKEIIETNGEML